MEIEAPILTQSQTHVRLTSQVQHGQKKFEVWVEVPIEYRHFVATDTTAFASAFVLPAARRHVDLKINGKVSKRWFQGVNKIIDRAATWNHGFKRIAAQVTEDYSEEKMPANFVGAFFSGGVDSFATLFKYQNHSEHAITHLIFVHGYDIAIDNSATFSVALPAIERVSRELSLPLIVVKTNVREVTDQLLGWEMAHGGALALVALILRKGFRSVIIPGGGTSSLPAEPWGSSSYLDPLWSTEQTTILHDLDEMQRLDKVREYIARSPLALELVRVCWRNTGYNCGKCDKCMMTLAELRMAGIKGKIKSFPNTLNLARLSTMYTTQFSIQSNVQEAVEWLEREQSDSELLAALKASLAYSDHPGLVKQLTQWVQQLDWKYNESRLFVFLHKYLRWS